MLPKSTDTAPIHILILRIDICVGANGPAVQSGRNRGKARMAGACGDMYIHFENIGSCHAGMSLAWFQA
jgi:hypothetical protein